MTSSDQLNNELHARRKKVYAAGGDEKIKKRHEKGLLTARERINLLFQDGTFQEIGAHVRHTATHFGMDKKEFPADAIIAGTGCIDGNMAAAFSQDFTVGAGTLGKMHARKMLDTMKFAMKMGHTAGSIQGLRWCQDTGGCRCTVGLWRSFLPECTYVRGGAANRCYSRALRRGRILFSSANGFHHYDPA